MASVTGPACCFFTLVLSVFMASRLCDGNKEHEGDYSAEGLMRGERLFYGLIDGKFEQKACADCHNTVEIDTFNWNPNAWEIMWGSMVSGGLLTGMATAVTPMSGSPWR